MIHDITFTSSLRLARKVTVAVVGSSVLALGVALIVLPGPAIVVIPLGLAILATEFLWARRFLLVVRKRIRRGGLTLAGVAVRHDSESHSIAAGRAPQTARGAT